MATIKSWYRLRRDGPVTTEVGTGPVFVMGLHRSGTTILYDELTRQFPLAKLTVYDVVNYENLLHDRAGGFEAQRHAALNDYFGSYGLRTRQVDGIELNPDTPEEYGWILHRQSGSFRAEERNVGALRELCSKLTQLHPEAQGVALKSPWDCASGPLILRHIPDARFIYVVREPLAILNSQLRNAVHYGSGRDPLLELFLAGIPAGRVLMAAQRFLYRAVGAGLYQRIMVRFLMRDVRAQLETMRRSLLKMPADRFLLFDYDALAQNPEAAFARMSEFLRLPLRQPWQTQLKPAERPLLQTVERLQERFARETGGIDDLRRLAEG